jgi:hypothetical protein
MEQTELNKALDDVGKIIVERLRRNASAEGFKATGKLSNSWGYKVIENELKIHAERYAGALANGGKPVSSSDEKSGKKGRLEEWIRAKGIRPYRKLKGGYKFAKMNTEKNSAYKGMLYAISRAIAEKGIVKRFNYKGSGFINLTLEQTKKQIENMLSEAYLKDITKELNNLGK